MNSAVNKEKIGYLLMAIIAIIVMIIIILVAPQEQDQNYHNFSDIREFLKIPNFWNVLSNLPLLIVGILGLYKLKSGDDVKNQFIIFFIGIVLVSFGSAYYHLNPNNRTLVWDRLPMTIGFMALFSALVSEYINDKIGKLLLFPALIIGLSSVLYWVIINDLIFYLAVQFFPMLTIPVMLIFFKSKYNLATGYWLLLIAYVIAKIFEKYDYETYALLGFLSGHSLKHIFTASGIYMLILKRIDRKEFN